MSDRDKQASDMFACSDRERAMFEAGIKMGTIYHQFVGTPVNIDTVSDLEGCIGRTICVQPYVKSAKVIIDKDVFGPLNDRYSYVSLTGDMIDAVVEITVGDTTVTAEMRYDPELDYPLMYISEVVQN